MRPRDKGLGNRNEFPEGGLSEHMGRMGGGTTDCREWVTKLAKRERAG
jgi:hypothetical protein